MTKVYGNHQAWINRAIATCAKRNLTCLNEAVRPWFKINPVLINQIALKNKSVIEFRDNKYYLNRIISLVPASVEVDVPVILKQFLNNFGDENLEGCRQLINQPEFDVNYIFTQNELKTKLLNFPITQSTSTQNILHLIARLGKQWSLPLITSILDRGVNIDLPNSDGWTVLMMAACHSNNTSSLETVKVLILAGAKLDLQNKGDCTALMKAAGNSKNTSSLETVETLISAGAKLDLQDIEGYTALISAARYSTDTSSLETVETLISAGAKLDIQNKYGWTALITASLHSKTSSSLETVRLLISAGANLDLQNKDGSTALISASCYSTSTSSLETVETLISAGANLDLQSKNGSTALMIAACYSNNTSSLETVKALIRAGANLDLPNIDGTTALYLAARDSNGTSSLETVRLLISFGAKLDIQNKYGWTALITASLHSKTSSSLETVRLLISAGANLDLQNNEGKTALMKACDYKNTNSSFEIVELLIGAGTNLDLKTEDGLTALMLTRCPKIKTLIGKALFSNECFQNHAKFVQDYDQSFEKLRTQFESDLDEAKTKTILYNVSKINKLNDEGVVASASAGAGVGADGMGSRVCDICRDNCLNLLKCSCDDCGVICGACLTWYLEADPKLIPVSRQKVAGVYCLISQRHVFMVSQLIRTLMSLEPNREDQLEKLEATIQERYFTEQLDARQIIAKAEALENFRAQGQISSMVQAIENSILCDACPNCQRQFVSDGCEAVSCRCGFNFCNVCLVFKTRGDVHDHVLKCIQKNSLKSSIDYFISPSERNGWRSRQRCEKLRDFLNSSGIGTSDWVPILVSLFDKHKDLQPFLVLEFPEHKSSLI